MSELLKVVVDRNTWLRGIMEDPRGDVKSFLLRESDGKMCCLGFACLAAGLLPSDIAGQLMPHSLVFAEKASADKPYRWNQLDQTKFDALPAQVKAWIKVHTIHQDADAFYKAADATTIIQGMAKINDSTSYGLEKEFTEAQREEALIAVGAEAGIAFEFVN